ncbi:MAG TPA: YceI family protein [Williamwhitmania sp.]|nr:YceI family protein [Williamwhitmania sp.]
MKKVILVAVAVAAVFSAKAQDTWTVDKAHTSVNFSVTHLLISEVDGQFKNFEGTVISKSPDFVGAEISFTVDVNSISTDNEMRDNHLKSDAFFDAAKFPKMTFKSTSFTKVSGNKYALTGDLTIRDVTKRVTFDVTYGGTVKDGYGNTKAGFKATTVINRFDYGLKWNALTEAGGAVVGQDVTITINVEVAKDKKK